MKKRYHSREFAAITALVIVVVQCRGATQAPTVAQGNSDAPHDIVQKRAVIREPRRLALVAFALIPAGTFQMGGSLRPDDPVYDAPLHDVGASKFYIEKYEVSKALWDKITLWGAGQGYADLPNGEARAKNHPVQSVSWYDVVKWCNARSEMEGLTPCYYSDTLLKHIYRTGFIDLDIAMVKWDASGYRLPTEAEWERAARGGLVGKRFPWGDIISHRKANFNNFGREDYQTGTTNYHPKYWDGSHRNTGCKEYTDELYTSPVGSFAANGYGLYDMAGNVCEWCWDWMGNYPSSLQTDPRGPATGSDRAVRGGSFSTCAGACGVADRSSAEPASSGLDCGFRVAHAAIP